MSKYSLIISLFIVACSSTSITNNIINETGGSTGIIGVSISESHPATGGSLNVLSTGGTSSSSTGGQENPTTGGSSTALQGTGGNSTGGSSTTVQETGGNNATGGNVGTGGLTISYPETGGNQATGGALATGGSSILATGGSQNTGGNAVTGGLPSTGGYQATGGSATVPVCGNGIIEPPETCDSIPFNNDLGDGCTPLCMAEPSCPPGGGPCTTKCGDGIVLGSEQCDDGNAVSGDGCSPTCQMEAGFTCLQPSLGSTMVVPMVVRDFNAGGDFEKGGAFATGLNYANQNLLQNTLDTNGLKPILTSTTGIYYDTPNQDSGITSSSSFAQWYNDAAPISTNIYNGTVATTLNLYLNTAGTAYVNRYGVNGDGMSNKQYQSSNGSIFDGNPLFFPADAIAKPWSPDSQAQISGNYDPSWPVDPAGRTHNFSFTTEVRFWFKYDSVKSYDLTFISEDDMWVFINKKLAMDLGGIHTAVQGELTFGSTGTATVSVTPLTVTGGSMITTHPNLGLTNGNIFEIAIFQAQRQTKSSSYQISLLGFNMNHSVCVTNGN
jgi:fibro-slime domain-containing protein